MWLNNTQKYSTKSMKSGIYLPVSQQIDTEFVSSSTKISTIITLQKVVIRRNECEIPLMWPNPYRLVTYLL